VSSPAAAPSPPRTRARRVVLLVLAAVALFGPGPGHAPRSRGTGIAAADAPERLDPDIARPPADAPLALARARLDAKDLNGARDVLTTALAGPLRGTPAAVEWQFLLAKVETARGDRAASLRALEAVGATTHPLAPWARLRRAEALEETDTATSLSLSAALSAGDPRDAWPGRERARAVEARMLLRTGREAEALPRLRALVASARATTGAASVALPLADVLARSSDAAAREEALALYRRVASRAPLAEQGRAAETKATALLATLPEARRAALAEPSVDDAFARAESLAESGRHALAEEAFAAVAARTDVAADPARRCQAQLQQARARDRRRARAEAAALFVAVADACTDPEIRASARFNAGRALHNLARHDDALAQLETLERDAPAHRLADDALLRAAIVARDAGNDAGYAERLTVLPTRHPQGDMRSDARFLAAWRLRGLGRHAEALGELDRALAEGVMETDEGLRGRAAYWRARLLEELGRRAEAIDAHAALCTAAPLTYYAQLSLTQLARLDATRAERLRASWLGDGRGAALSFPERPEFARPGFLRAIALLRVGETELALTELGALGLTGEGADPDALWLTVALLDRAGQFGPAAQLFRKRLAQRLTVPPVGRARALWRIAYPRAYAPLLEESAAAENVGAALVRAIAREESSFDPEARSSVGAVGLIQLMGPTARRFAEPIGLPWDAAALRRPEVNLRVGARFLGFLTQRYPGRAGLVPGAYNAGEASVDRWRRARPDEPLDAFVENIPFDETRRYTRRVLQSWGVYALLDEQRLPRFWD
jgi:soluble lytic murein transglycosylase